MAAILPSQTLLTYEDYLAEGEMMIRCDIVDGVRIVTNPTRRHQHCALNIGRHFQDFERTYQQGYVVIAPCDILITVRPLRIRQPDVLFMSRQRWSQNPPVTDPAPLSPASELVVEIVSPSDKPSVLDGKIADYQRVGVRELWAVKPGSNAVALLDLTGAQARSVAEYGRGETVVSLTFPDLRVAVDDVFAE